MPSITFDINKLTEDQKEQIVEEFTKNNFLLQFIIR